MMLSLLQLTIVSFLNLSICYHATLRNEDILEMLPICYFWWMLTLLYLTSLSMYLRGVITAVLLFAVEVSCIPCLIVFHIICAIAV